MIQKLLLIIRGFIPAWALRVYHFILAFVGHAVYGFPSKRMIVFGVTGTKGKTTTCAALAHVLEQAGFTVALSSTATFKIGKVVETNQYKVSMPGRCMIPRFLSKALKAGCRIAIIESTSEGVLQFRHRFIDYDFFVFTNVYPEHLERHGGFEHYKNAKLELVRRLRRSKLKNFGDAPWFHLKPKSSEVSSDDHPDSSSAEARDTNVHKDVLQQSPEQQYAFPSVSDGMDNHRRKGIIVNLDDEYADEFLDAAGDVEKIGVTIQESSKDSSAAGPAGQARMERQAFAGDIRDPRSEIQKNIAAQHSNITIRACGWNEDSIHYQDTSYHLRVPGLFNARNIALASAAASFVGVSFAEALRFSERFEGVPGRWEVLSKGDIVVVIDYAHEPFSLEEILKLTKARYRCPIVHVFGATGGGRDGWKRPKMGEISARYADRIVLTNDDPYDENQIAIVNAIVAGIDDPEKVEIELDRSRAIRRALEIASAMRCDDSEGDGDKSSKGVVLITGKGSETVQCFERGTKVEYNDRRVVESLLNAEDRR